MTGLIITEENLRFKIVRASLIVGRKFTVFALFYFVFEGNFQGQAPGGCFIYLESWLLTYIIDRIINENDVNIYLEGGLYMVRLIFRMLTYLGKEFHPTRGVWYGDFRFNIRIFTCMEDVGMSYPFLL